MFFYFFNKLFNDTDQEDFTVDELYKFIMSLEIKTYPQLKVYTDLLELPRDLLIKLLTMLKDGEILYTDLIPSKLALSKYRIEEYQKQVYNADTHGQTSLSEINIYSNIRDMIISAFNIKLNKVNTGNILSLNVSDENEYKINLISKFSGTLSLEDLEKYCISFVSQSSLSMKSIILSQAELLKVINSGESLFDVLKQKQLKHLSLMN